MTKISAMFYNSIIILSIFVSLTSCNQSLEPISENGIALLQIDPEYSGDGEEIVYNGLYDSIYAVHFIKKDGTPTHSILNSKGFLNSPTWSPDNKKIVVSIEGDLCMFNINGDSLNKLTDTGEDFFCSWSPDGRFIAYTKSICDPNCGISVYDFNTKRVNVVGPYGSYASWNERGDKIYYYHNFYSAPPGSEKGDYKGFIFKRVNPLTLKTDSLFYVDNPNLWLTDCTVSPDEKEILFAAAYDSPARSNIWKVDLVTKEMFQMTFEGGECPSYSPNGQTIVYTNTNLSEGGLWHMNRDGSNKQRLTKKQR